MTVSDGSRYPVPIETFEVPTAVAEAPQGGGVSLVQILSIARHYWLLSAIIIVLVLAATVTAAWLQPKTYIATATLIITGENKDPLAGDQLPLALLGAYVNTQAELITSPVVLGPVVDALSLTRDPQYARGFRGDPASLKDYTEKQLSFSLDVEIGRGGQLLFISATNRNAERAAQVANSIADTYLAQEKARLNGPAAERAQRYSEQVVELREKVAVAQNNLTAFRDRNHLTGSTADPDTETQALASLEARLLDAQNTRRTAETTLGDSATVNDVTVNAKLVDGLTEKLASLQAQAAQLQSTLGPQHPRLLELQSEISATRSALTAQMSVLSRGNTVRVRAAQELEKKYQDAVNQQRAAVEQTQKLQDEGSKLALELESAQAVYKRALDGYDQVMFASSGNNSHASLINRAVPPAQSARHRAKLLLAGFAASLGLGLAIPLLYELVFNRRLRCRDDFEKSFQIPVLAEIDSSADGDELVARAA